MKKTLSVILAVIMALGCVLMLASCGGTAEETTAADDTTVAAEDTTAAAESDLAYIKEKGEMIIGYTEFAPMNYIDAKGEFVGFETEFAKAICEELGVKAKFQLIDWSAKETELKGKTIDCIWNGMTITPERLDAMSISTPYMANKQVVIVKKENADKYTKAEDFDGANVVAEIESAGEEVAKTNEFFATANYQPVDTQAKTLMEVKSGVADCAVVDYVLSIGMIGEGTDYEDLVVVDALAFADEEYGIAFRKGSDVTDAVNAAITALVESGKLAKIAEAYKLGDQLIAK